MTGPDADAATLAFYESEAERYVGQRPGDATPALSRFLDRLTPGATILELGCGGGHNAAGMLARGFAVEASDGSTAMAALAEAALQRPVRVMRFDELADVDRYDAIVANAALLHVPLPALPGILARLWWALRPGGWHFASYKTGGDDGRDRVGRYYNRPSLAQLESDYRSAGDWCEWHAEASHEPGWFGEPSDWLSVSCRKRGT